MWRRIGWGLFVAADVCVSTLFVLGYAARSVSPETEWRLQLAALVLPGAAAATTVAGAVWLLRATARGSRAAWAALSVHAVLTGAVLLRFGSLGGADGLSAEPTDAAFRVFSLNAGGSLRPESVAISDVLDRMRPDVVAFQEVAVRRLDGGVGLEGASALAAPPVAMAAFRRGYHLAAQELEETNPTTLSRHPMTQTHAGSLGAADDETAGVYARTVLPWGGREIAVYNVHLRSFNARRPSVPGEGQGIRAWFRALDGLGRDFVLRAWEAERLNRLLEQEPLPFVVAGDLNTTPHQWVYARVSAGLQDALEAAPGWTATYPDRRPLVQIDAIFASPEWDVVAASVGPRGLSDHRAVAAELNLGRGR